MPSEYPVPKRRSIIEETADALRTRIAGQVWTTHLPGERTLAEMMQVGRDTLRAALNILHNEGLIDPPGQGARRKIHFQSKPNPTKDAHRVAIISPWHPAHIPASTLLEIDTLKSLLFSRGISLQLLTPSVFHLKNPGKILSRCVGENNADLWVLYRSTQAMQAWFQNKKIPCLLRGHPQSGITLNKLDTDWEATSYHAGLQLQRIGHTHIGFIAPKEILQGISAAKTGLAKAVSKAGKISWITEPGTREGFCRVLESIFKAPAPPTALVVTQPREAATALTWLSANKIMVPEQVSLISLADDPNLDVLVPIITRYTIPTQALARLLCRHILRLLNEQPIRRETPLFMPEFISGETIAPAHK